MPFIKDLLQYKSCSIVGLEKNTGKTECLNYILRNFPMEQSSVAVTSIGIDGETIDQVTNTSKPEILLRKGMYFATSEKHYRNRKLLSELLEVSEETTSLGRIVTAKALSQGKILLSGPSSTSGLVRWMQNMANHKVDHILIDGALSRMSLASPAVSESMILSTGAAFSSNINSLVQRTAFVVELINLAETDKDILSQFEAIQSGVWAIDEDNELKDLGFSSLTTQINADNIVHAKILFVAGALTDTFLAKIRSNHQFDDCELVVKDFTHIFASPLEFHSFAANHKISVLRRSKLIAITVNPTSPNGITLHSDKLCNLLSEAVNLPVYDLRKIENHF